MVGVDGDDGIRRIVSFEPALTKKLLFGNGSDWLALDTAFDDAPSETLSNSNKYPEGAKKEITINAVERNPKARAACINHHGHNCVPCGFNFMAIYGEIGREYIHVHHIFPLKLREKEYEVDPINDLVPVCPNCHAMIHRTEPCLTITELQKVLKRRDS
jgi:5-methylcytosine-specific restriction protein A